MQSYKEYPIRCKTCGEPIAPFAGQYEALLENIVEEDRIAQIEAVDGPLVGTLTQPLNEINIAEKALNRLGITEWCSRIAMMNPTIVTFNMENRAVIEGTENIDAANDADAEVESEFQPIFASCKGPRTAFQITQNQPVEPIRQLALSAATPAALQVTSAVPSTTGVSPLITGAMAQARRSPTTPGLNIIRTPTGISPITSISATSGATTVESVIQPIIEGIDLEEPALETVVAPTTFQNPVIVGVPTINASPYPTTTINVGAGARSMVLTGRTFLAY